AAFVASPRGDASCSSPPEAHESSRALVVVLPRRSRKMLPHSPAPTDAANVPILAISSSAPSPNAKFAMNNDIVKPIPQSQLAPKIFPQDTSRSEERRVGEE